ncbi:ATP-binding protein [Billgrantia gudaonensis]|uniref:histidine kinase n=1 Tax=Billgrantia gudaonensis TaxID=376427 RepID=A0A1G9BS35_9GAMM|nr:ATP-binding protein [Halomonas gudaonensis]SDK42262.1 Signal transduction histidine kinase [Halomonas gudaonensis]
MSLRLRLLLTLGLTLLLLWGVAAAWMMRDLHEEVVATLDQRLAQSARMVAGLMAQLPIDVWQQADRRALSIPPIEGLACQVHSPRGEIVARTHTDLETILSAGERGHAYREADGVTWRVFTYERGGLVITTADRMDERNQLLDEVVRVAVVPFIVALLGSLAAVWAGVVRGLAPLERLRAALMQRHSEALEPVAERGVPAEIRPFVDALNALLVRVRGALQREQRFTDDAAHELRTPLTAIKTHLQVARRVDGAASQRAMAHAEEGVGRLSRTLDQLLMLARVEGRLDVDDEAGCELAEVVNLACRDVDPAGRAHIVSPGRWPPHRLALPRSLAATALRNLIENALRHGAEPVALEARSECEGRITLVVRDHGEGVSEAECRQLTQRFWRASQQQGSGLGLAVVAAIAERFGGRVRFARADEGGLEARLTLPLIREEGAAG